MQREKQKEQCGATLYQCRQVRTSFIFMWPHEQVRTSSIFYVLAQTFLTYRNLAFFFFPALILLSCKRFRVGPALELRFLTQFSYVSCRSGRVSLKISFLNPFENRSPVSGTNHSKRTAVPFRGQTTQISSGLPPKRDCGSKGRPPYTAHIEQW